MFQKVRKMDLHRFEPIRIKNAIKTNEKDRVRKGFRDSIFSVFVLLSCMEVMSKDKQCCYKSNNADRVH